MTPGRIGKAPAYLGVVSPVGPQVAAVQQVSCLKRPLDDGDMIQSVDDESWGWRERLKRNVDLSGHSEIYQPC